MDLATVTAGLAVLGSVLVGADHFFSTKAKVATLERDRDEDRRDAERERAALKAEVQALDSRERQHAAFAAACEARDKYVDGMIHQLTLTIREVEARVSAQVAASESRIIAQVGTSFDSIRREIEALVARRDP